MDGERNREQPEWWGVFIGAVIVSGAATGPIARRILGEAELSHAWLDTAINALVGLSQFGLLLYAVRTVRQAQQHHEDRLVHDREERRRSVVAPLVFDLLNEADIVKQHLDRINYLFERLARIVADEIGAKAMESWLPDRWELADVETEFVEDFALTKSSLDRLHNHGRRVAAAAPELTEAVQALYNSGLTAYHRFYMGGDQLKRRPLDATRLNEIFLEASDFHTRWLAARSAANAALIGAANGQPTKSS